MSNTTPLAGLTAIAAARIAGRGHEFPMASRGARPTAGGGIAQVPPFRHARRAARTNEP
jgi:hypothetical protein